MALLYSRGPMASAAAQLPLSADRGKVGAREWLALVLAAAALLGLTYLVPPNVFSSIDWLRIHVYYKECLAAALRHGRLPFWNPYVALGRPFLADVDSVAFYPPSLAYIFLDVHTACALGIGLHLLLGLYGSLKLARALAISRWASWAVALVFMSSAPIVGSFSSGLINYGASLCYIPLVFYLCVRLQAARSLRLVAVLGLVLGLQLLAGHPQASWLTYLGAGFFLAGRRVQSPLWPSLKLLAVELCALGVAIIAASGMAAVVLLPLAELAGQSNRQAPSLAFAGSYAMTRWSWMTLSMPNDPHAPQQANAQIYAGILVFLAAPAVLLRWRERNVRALALLVGVAALLAAGNATPVFHVFYEVIPGLRHFRIPSRATVLITLGLVLAAGTFFSSPPTKRLPWIPIVASVVALWVVLAYTRDIVVYRGASHVSCAHALVAWYGPLVATATLLILAWSRRDRLRFPHASVLLAFTLGVLTTADLAAAADKLRVQNREYSSAEAEENSEKAFRDKGLFTPDSVPPRIAAPFLFHENAGMRHGWSTWVGYTSMTLGRVWEYIHTNVGLPISTDQVAYPDGEILERGPFAYDSMALKLGSEPKTHRLVLRAKPDPRAYLAPAAVSVANHHEASQRMREGHPFHTIALVEGPAPPGILARAPATPFDGKADIVHFEPERISMHVHSSKPAILVLAEAWYPNWQATVNGRPTDCFPANAWMRATLVPAGSSDVVFTYRPTTFSLGAGISLASFAILLLGLWLRRRATVVAAPATPAGSAF